MFDEEQGFTINDLGRRLANIIRIGTIFEIDFEEAKARVKIGDLETDFLPWVNSNSGSNNSWNPPEMDVTICKDKSAEYVPCIVQRLNFVETKNPSTWTVLGKNDKIMVRIERNGKMRNPNRKLPLTIKMI